MNVRMAPRIYFDWYLPIVCVFVFGSWSFSHHLNKKSKCSYHVNRLPNLETMVCEKVERMEYVHLLIPYETQ